MLPDEHYSIEWHITEVGFGDLVYKHLDRQCCVRLASSFMQAVSPSAILKVRMLHQQILVFLQACNGISVICCNYMLLRPPHLQVLKLFAV